MEPAPAAGVERMAAIKPAAPAAAEVPGPVEASGVEVDPVAPADSGATLRSPEPVRPTDTLATAQGPASPEPEALRETVIRNVRHLVVRGDQQVKVRLVPESLGELVIEVTSGDDGVQVKLTAGTAAVRDVLESQVHGLRDALARDGIDVARVAVTADAPGSGFSETLNRPTGQESAPSRSSHSGSAASYREPPVPAQTAPRGARHAGRLDLYA